ncbi:MAG: serpin family protein [Candidatus Aenigmatarchaeota archaeon]
MKHIVLIGMILIVVLVSGCTQTDGDPSPSIIIDLEYMGNPSVGEELLIRLHINPATGLGEEFFDTQASVEFDLPDSFELLEGESVQNIVFTDFETKTIEIKVKPTETGNFDVKSTLAKQNSGQFWKTIQVAVSTPPEQNNMFALDLYNRYKSEDGNLFFSPYSISSALSMTYEGAKGQTAEEMQAVLHLPDDKNKIRADFVSIYDELNKADKSYKLTAANALWAQEDYPFVDEYFNVVDEYYDGKVTNLDFKTDTENSRVTINDWVEDKTNDKIKDLIPEGILSSATKLVLTNAIYFKANWSNQFDVENTWDGKFKLSSGQDVDARMMHKTTNYSYGETDNLQILEMDYIGNDLSMLIILPKDNKLNQVENDFSKEKLEDWKNNMQTEKVRVTLPKFKFETKYFMAEDLKEMGMPTAFRYPDADFTGMSPTGELFISEVIHQTFIEVAEYGTEAAAATAVISGEGSAGPTEEPKIFNADHPFIFIIQQKDSGNILFMGRMSDPS